MRCVVSVEGDVVLAPGQDTQVCRTSARNDPLYSEAGGPLREGDDG